jgi:hypothetical protein
VIGWRTQYIPIEGLGLIGVRYVCDFKGGVAACLYVRGPLEHLSSDGHKRKLGGLVVAVRWRDVDSNTCQLADASSFRRVMVIHNFLM